MDVRTLGLSKGDRSGGYSDRYTTLPLFTRDSTRVILKTHHGGHREAYQLFYSSLASSQS